MNYKIQTRQRKLYEFVIKLKVFFKYTVVSLKNFGCHTEWRKVIMSRWRTGGCTECEEKYHIVT